ncbi:uncharacterized protein STEHIDRAFT_138982 [Stereum hirsutum FP-91666 SS1]|uniref:uncharacterized protein n=1 Tax=Stereum hirsutum (strain FP-91666) TaxID=721885 RepID=UPI000440B1FF|nr:uncharacterized protein STEHIDRAFT_138982 [Stereum hirsutum FP-91666 SS1]EIM87184.1 hypothetical protein STEHIDRAFT_138982 [Stereum hirsutum FP-91666 SS1]
MTPGMVHVCVHCGQAAPIQHSVWYVEMVELVVKDTLFKVPRFIFDDHLQSFTRMVSPSRNTTGIPGPKGTVDLIVQSHDRSFSISDDITVDEMESFLKAFIPKFSIPKGVELTLSDHLSVLKLATRWGFSELRNQSIEAATPRFKYPTDLITYGQRYMVPQWPIEGYKRIIKGTYPSLEVASKLGSKPFYYLMAVRDQYLQTTPVPAQKAQKLFAKKGSTNSLNFDFDTKIVALIDAGYLEGALPPDYPATCETSTDSDMTIDGNGKEDYDKTIEVAISAIYLASLKSAPLKPSRLYCIETATFLAENTLFCVPRFRLVENKDSPFASMFTLPLGDVEAEGTSSTRPIKLPPDIKDTDFANFLEVLYPEYISSPYLTPSMSDAWTAILGLATQWQFDDVRKKAIDVLGDQEKNAIRKIILGRQYSISSWLVAAYVELAGRDDSKPLTVEEEKVLGDATVVKLLKIEAERRKGEREGTVCDLTEKVKEAFKDELMEDEEYRRKASALATTAASPSDTAPV